MKPTTRWVTAWLFLLALMLSGCASGPGPRLPIDLTKIPITITIPPDEPPAKVEPAKPRATLAFEMLDEFTGAPIPTAFATCDDGIPKQADDHGYIAVEREVGLYLCRFEADGYQEAARRFQLEGNRQFAVRLKSLKPPEPPPAPAPPVVVVPAPSAPSAPSAPLAPSCVEIECVRQAAAKYGELLQINTYESCVEFTQRVLELLGPDWGHVGKTAGESQSVPHGFTPVDVRGFRITGVSHDAIKHRLTGQVVDLLGNASANSDPDPKIHGPASIQWAPVPAQYWREQNPYVPAVPIR